MTVETSLQQAGLSKKESATYLALLDTGSASVRTLAAHTGINRGTVYEALKQLQQKGLVSYFHKNTRQLFVAEDPGKLTAIVKNQAENIRQVQEELNELIPQLRSRISPATTKPVVKYYEGSSGIRTILEDVLTTMAAAKEKEYYAYSAADVREHLYKDFPHFAKKRVEKGIRVKVIALGSGGKLWGMDERKWLTKIESAPAYIILYNDKVATISLDADGKLHGILITDHAITQTQKSIFEQLFTTLT
ncbi:MAG: helix-turn-helix domain-containing protein [Parcubacteria group bacterium]